MREPTTDAPFTWDWNARRLARDTVADECLPRTIVYNAPERDASTSRAVQRVKDMLAGCSHYQPSGFCVQCLVRALEGAERAGMAMTAPAGCDSAGWPVRDAAGT